MSTAHLPPAEPPDEAAAELRDKLGHARRELEHAQDTLARLRGGVRDMRSPEPGIAVPSWVPDFLEQTEIPAAYRRVELWQDVVDELLRQLDAL